MALFSAWDWDRNSYRVYETPQLVSVGDDPSAPPKPSSMHPLGAVPDLDVKPLPSGARFVGYSQQARGEIVRLPFGSLGQAVSAADGQRVLVKLAVGTAAILGFAWLIQKLGKAR